MFVNLSNHPSAQWPEDQLATAERIASPIRDFPFPSVDPTASPKAVGELAQAIGAEVLAWGATAAMVEGEFTLTYALVQLLMRAGVMCYAATSKRETTATLQIDGSVARNSVYRFVTLRRYVDDL